MKKYTISEKIDFFDSVVSRRKIEKDGINLSIWCPFCKHNDRSKLKLTIHLEKNFYHCWLCDAKGSNVSKIIYFIDKSRANDAKSIFSYRKKQKFDLFFSESEVEEKIIVSVPEGFQVLANNYSSLDPDARDIFKYAIKRGTNKHKMWFLRMGYSKHFEFRRSLILPSFDDCGKINFYTARRIDDDTNSSYKYKNAKVSKKDIVFNELNIDWKQPLTIVEGPLDLIKTNDNATCLLGSTLTEDMMLFRKIVSNKTEVCLALDRDVHYKASYIAKTLRQYDVSVKIVDTSAYEDVGEMPSLFFQEKLLDAKTFHQDEFLLSKIRKYF